MAVLCIDLDGFRLINDTWGYTAGNEILVAVANRLGRLLRDYDMLTRIAADQYVLVVDRLSEHDADRMAARIESAVSEPIETGGRSVAVTCSIGIAIGGATDSPDQLISASDHAMHQAKLRGRADHCVYRSGDRIGTATHLDIGQQLRAAIDNGELTIEYQPVVDILTGRVVSVEALTHWDHPSRGRISPGEFVPVAESSGLIRAMGDWVLRTACEQLAEAAARIPDWGGSLAVNASAYQLFDPSFVERIADYLSTSGLVPDRLCIEVTESVLLRTDALAIDVTRRIKELGVRLAVDDFGTGYASLSYLRELPFDVIKVDRTFTGGLMTNRVDEVLTRAIIEVGSVLGIPVIVEGVETEDQLKLVKKFGGTLVQGYYFLRPCSWNVTEAFIRSGFWQALSTNDPRNANLPATVSDRSPSSRSAAGHVCGSQ